jgi:hypothetical protein
VAAEDGSWSSHALGRTCFAARLSSAGLFLDAAGFGGPGSGRWWGWWPSWLGSRRCLSSCGGRGCLVQPLDFESPAVDSPIWEAPQALEILDRANAVKQPRCSGLPLGRWGIWAGRNPGRPAVDGVWVFAVNFFIQARWHRRRQLPPSMRMGRRALRRPGNWGGVVPGRRSKLVTDEWLSEG